jgi:Tfp pilus assembly protein PilN
MRPVNLIPEDQRRAAQGTGAPGLPTFIFLGGLAVAVLVVLGIVITNNQINDRKGRVGELEARAARAERSASALAPYGNFARLQEARVATVKALADSRFNWERVIRALSRTIPSDVWLVSFKGTLTPDVQVEAEGGEGGTATMRTKTPAPAIELTGCTYNHEAVARMMVRMRNIDGVSEVALAKSERPEASDSQSSGGNSGEAEAASTSGGDCRTEEDITKFEILLALGNAQVQPVSTPAAEGGAATPVAQAQSAASASGSSAASSTASAGQSTPAPSGAGQ